MFARMSKTCACTWAKMVLLCQDPCKLGQTAQDRRPGGAERGTCPGHLLLAKEPQLLGESSLGCRGRPKDGCDPAQSPRMTHEGPAGRGFSPSHHVCSWEFWKEASVVEEEQEEGRTQVTEPCSVTQAWEPS